MVNKAREGASSCNAWIKSELTISDDFEQPIANLKFDSFTSVVAAGAEANVFPTLFDKLPDASVSGTIQSATVSLISTTRKD